MIDPSRLLVFTLAALALIVIPGPAVLYIVAQSINGGRVAGLVSAAGVATGFASGLKGLVACRVWLGAAEAAVIPGNSKANGMYVEPRQRAFGLNQFGRAQ